MGHHLRARLERRITQRIASWEHLLHFALAFFNSYRLAELLPLLPLVLCLVLLSCLPDWALGLADKGAEWALCWLALGGRRAEMRDPDGNPTGESKLYSIVGALDCDFRIPDERLLCVPRSEAEQALAFPSRHAAGWGNAAFLALCMKLAYEDWSVVRDVVNHEWRPPAASAAAAADGLSGARRHLTPRFIAGCSFNFMQPIGSESSEELAHVHLDSDAVLLAVEDAGRPAASSDAGGAGAALVLAFRGTEPLELADFQSDFDAVPELGDWGCLHPGFLLALGLDPNLDAFHQTLTTYTLLQGDEPAPVVMASQRTTPYEVLRDRIITYMTAHPAARLYVTGHSLGGALAVVFMGALMHDRSKALQPVKARVGALYTFGQPRVGDYEFLCHLQVSLLEPSAAASSAQQAGAAVGGSSGGASKLRGLLGGAKQDESAAPPLTSRYIRVVNTFDIVPHIPPCICELYQHGGDLLFLRMKPGDIKFLAEQPVLHVTSIWTSSVFKLAHYTKVGLGLEPRWKGCDNWLRYGMRIASVLMPFFIAGLDHHMPGDYAMSVINSDPAAWQPFRARKKLSRWTHAVLFTRALATASSGRMSGADGAGLEPAAEAGADAPAPAQASSTVTRTKGGRATLSSKLQAQLMQHSDRAAARGTAPPPEAPPAGAANGSADRQPDDDLARVRDVRTGLASKLRAVVKDQGRLARAVNGSE